MSQVSISFDVATSTPLEVRDIHGQYQVIRADEVLSKARAMLSEQVRRGATLSAPQLVKDYLELLLAELGHEVFVVLFLDVQMRLIEVQEMFRGTLTQTSVYPREVVKAALMANASAVVLAHNHP